MSTEKGASPKLLTKVIHRHFGEGEHESEPQGGGMNNSVYSVDHTEGKFVIRFGGESASIDTFRKERWAVERAAERGVPVAPILHVGEEEGQPYMVMQLIDGSPATEFAENLDILEQLGRWAAEIHTIETHGIGEVFDWADRKVPRSGDWRTYLREELEVDRRLETLSRHGMLSEAQTQSLRATLEEIGAGGIVTHLNHGDLRLKNLMVDVEGKILAIIDWEFCTANVTPLWDMAITLHDLSVDQKGAFLKGYGIGEEDFLALTPAMRALNVINYAPFVDAAAQEKDEEVLQNFRLRLSGALDLYVL